MTLIGILLAGAVAGFVLGFAGAGGTIVGIPCYLYIADVAPHQTFGTNALGVAAIALFLVMVRGLRRELHYKPGIAFAIPGVVGAYFGTRASTYISGSRLVFLLGFVVLIVSGYIYYLSTRTAPGIRTAAPVSPRTVVPEASLAASRLTGPANASHIDGSRGPSMLRISPLGLVVGAVSGFFGIGGGFMIVPGTSWAARIDLKAAAAASLIPIAAFAALVGVRYTSAGSVSLPHAGIMALTGIIFGSLGIWLSAKVATKRFQQAFAGLLVVLGIYMIVSH